jgi:hypothetical protein
MPNKLHKKRDVERRPQEQAPARADLQESCPLTDRWCSIPAPKQVVKADSMTPAYLKSRLP